MKTDMTTLIAFVDEHFSFSEEKYPQMVGMNEQERHDFIVRHLALHLGKFSGKVIGVSEKVDHGSEEDTEALHSAITKLIIATLRLAGETGMSGEDIIRAIEKKYGATIPRKE